MLIEIEDGGRRDGEIIDEEDEEEAEEDELHDDDVDEQDNGPDDDGDIAPAAPGPIDDVIGTDAVVVTVVVFDDIYRRIKTTVISWHFLTNIYVR